MLDAQIKMKLYDSNEIYQQLIPEDDLFLQIDRLVDFSFVFDELRDNYSENMGRKAYDPIQLFKYLLAKPIYKLSDADIVRRSRTDLALKRFVGLDLLDEPIEASTLTKFRKLRIKDPQVFNRLISKTLEVAQENGLKLSTTLIIDATHIQSVNVQRYCYEEIHRQTKALFKSFPPTQIQEIQDQYQVKIRPIEEKEKERFLAIKRNQKRRKRAQDQAKKKNLPVLEVEQEDIPELDQETIAQGYQQASQEAIQAIQAHIPLVLADQEKIRYLQELHENTQNDVSDDPDAQTGYKDQDKPFYGYKGHLAIEKESLLVTAFLVTGGKSGDGEHLVSLTQQTKENLPVEEILADTAYSGQENLTYAQEEQIKLRSKLHPVLSQRIENVNRDGFTYDKDADQVLCPAGEISYRQSLVQAKEGESPRMYYFFSQESCQHCRHKSTYHKGKSSHYEKAYTISLPQDVHLQQHREQQTEEFKEAYKERYRIEAKHADLKNNYHLHRAKQAGVLGVTLQLGAAIFASNMKRIVNFKAKKQAGNEERKGGRGEECLQFFQSKKDRGFSPLFSCQKCRFFSAFI